MDKYIKKNCPLIILILLLLFLSFGVPNELSSLSNNIVGKSALLIMVMIITKKCGLLHGCLAVLIMLLLNNQSFEGFKEGESPLDDKDADTDDDTDADADADADADDADDAEDDDDKYNKLLKKIKKLEKFHKNGKEGFPDGGLDDDDEKKKESFISRKTIKNTFNKLNNLFVNSRHDIRLASAAQRVQSNLNTLTASI
jgi:hypothetical protein